MLETYIRCTGISFVYNHKQAWGQHSYKLMFCLQHQAWITFDWQATVILWGSLERTLKSWPGHHDTQNYVYNMQPNRIYHESVPESVTLVTCSDKTHHSQSYNWLLVRKIIQVQIIQFILNYYTRLHTETHMIFDAQGINLLAFLQYWTQNKYYIYR